MSSNFNSADFFNAMPHPFHLFATVNDAKVDQPAGTLMTVAPSGSVARLVEEKGTTGATVDAAWGGIYPHGFPPRFGGVEGLPPAEQLTGKVLIVSMLVGDYYAKNPAAAKATGALHIVGPDSGTGAVRDSKGGIAGTTKFVIYS